jgi:hypothetical protein
VHQVAPVQPGGVGDFAVSLGKVEAHAEIIGTVAEQRLAVRALLIASVA